MTKSPILSIIIPVFNTENYILRCLETIINQSLDDYEIIIINDGSTDDSDSIIRHRIRGLDNVKYYELKNNVGIGNARNLGIAYSKGDYVGFIDSDDWVDLIYYEKMLHFITADNSDICISGVKAEYDDVYFSKNRYFYPSHIQIDGVYALHSLTDMYNHDTRITPIVNNKLYKKSIIVDNDIRFDKTRRSQDNYFSFMSLLYSNKVSLVNDVFYHYYQRFGSATHDFSKKYINEYIFVLNSIKETLIKRNLFKIYEKEYNSYVNRCIFALINRLFSEENDVRVQKEYIIYILKKVSNTVPIYSMMEYIDISRFKEFWKI